MALVRWSGAFLYVIPAKAGIYRQNSGVLVEREYLGGLGITSESLDPHVA